MSAYNPFLPYDDSRDADESNKDHTVEFDKLVQKLNRAYCDAYMTALKYSAVGDRYIFLDFNCGPHSAKISDVSRPSATGEGGGVKLEPECMGGDYIETFNALRAEVDQTVKRYRDLPSGSSMHDTCSKCDSWARALSPREEDNFETVAGWIEATKSTLKDQHSSTLDRVSIDMVGKIQPALSILQEATFALTSLISTNRHAILTARREIRDAITVATEACNDYTKYRIVAAMKIASTTLNIVEKIGNIMKGDLGEISNSIDMVSGWLTVDEEIDWLSYYAIITPSAIISKLGKGLKKINENLTAAEGDINDRFKTISLQLSRCEQQGQLRIDQQDHRVITYSNPINFDWPQLKRVYTDHLPQTALTLRDVKAKGHFIHYTTAFARSSSIGFGALGAWSELRDTIYLIQDCIERVAESCDGIARGLSDFEQDMKATETDSTNSINKIRTSLKKYTTTSPNFPPIQ